MTLWRNVLVSGLIGASLLAACTVTTSSGGDGGVWNETGGAVSTGGAGNVGGGASTGGTSVTTTTVVQCTANFDESVTPRCGNDTETTSCDSCLQSYECNTEYKTCYTSVGCQTLISEMQQCMATAFDSTPLPHTLPANAEATCLATYGLDTATTTDTAEAKALWDVIRVSLDCSEVCCANITAH